MGSAFSTDTSAAAEQLTAYIAANCFVNPADFPPTFANALRAKAVYVPVFIWISCLVLGYFTKDLYLTLCGLAFALDFWLLNPTVRQWIDEPPPFAGCGGATGSPNVIAEQLTILFVLVYTFPVFYRARRLDFSLVLAMVGVWTFVTYVLIFIGMASARQIIVGMLIGAFLAVVFQVGVFFLIFPAYQRDPWSYYTGSAKWVSWPVLWVFHLFGKDMRLCEYNNYFCEKTPPTQSAASVDNGGATTYNDQELPGGMRWRKETAAAYAQPLFVFSK
jgi:hypothetical protein